MQFKHVGVSMHWWNSCVCHYSIAEKYEFIYYGYLLLSIQVNINPPGFVLVLSSGNVAEFLERSSNPFLGVLSVVF